MIGSSSTAPSFRSPSRKAALAAISKASADEFDFVIGAVDERHLEIDYRKAGQNACALSTRLRPFLLLEYTPLHRATDHLRFEFESLADLVRLDYYFHACELAAAPVCFLCE